MIYKRLTPKVIKNFIEEKDFALSQLIEAIADTCYLKADKWQGADLDKSSDYNKSAKILYRAIREISDKTENLL